MSICALPEASQADPVQCIGSLAELLTPPNLHHKHRRSFIGDPRVRPLSLEMDLFSASEVSHGPCS
jgi:hypothetical protein